MFYTTERLFEATGCVTADGLRMWLKEAGIPYSENGKGKPQVMEQFAHMVGRASNAIEKALDGTKTLKRKESAVYLLKRNGVVVYVGMSKSLLSRLGKHCTGALTFDEIDVIPVKPEYALLLETELIARYTPKHNSSKLPLSAKTSRKTTVRAKYKTP